MSRSKCYDKGSQDVPAWQGSPVLCGGDAAGDSEYQHLQPPPPPMQETMDVFLLLLFILPGQRSPWAAPS